MADMTMREALYSQIASVRDAIDFETHEPTTDEQWAASIFRFALRFALDHPEYAEVVDSDLLAQKVWSTSMSCDLFIKLASKDGEPRSLEAEAGG